MKIADIDTHLDTLKDQALAALNITPDVRARIRLTVTPENQPGDRGFPVFALAKTLGKSPALIAQHVVQKLEALDDVHKLVSSYKATGPYINMTLNQDVVTRIILSQIHEEGGAFGANFIAEPESWMIEYSAPNTNKPQHLGHVRNDLLGESVASILEFAGHTVTRVNLINDRGIHICKSMLAYKEFGKNQTPESMHLKGDHLVGHFYVLFNKKLEQEYTYWKSSAAATAKFQEWLKSPAAVAARKTWHKKICSTHPECKEALKTIKKKDCQAHYVTHDAEITDAQLSNTFFQGYKDTYFNTESVLGAKVRQMLIDWEAGHEDVLKLWNTMNAWVFAGFDETYTRLGIRFDAVYRESDTYKLGKDLVLQGLKDGVFTHIEGGAIGCNLAFINEPDKHKVLLRSNGTSVYMTQDLGTAMERFDTHDIARMIYVVGNEQDYHFKVLFGILAKLRPELDGKLKHLSYGMVELPDGKMKSREGRVVDADDLMDAMIDLARGNLILKGMIEATPELRNTFSQDRTKEEETLKEICIQGMDLGWDKQRKQYSSLTHEVFEKRAFAIGMAALKYYVLGFNPKTTVHFDPDNSIKPTGRTGVYALYTYARIQSILRKTKGWPTFENNEARLAAWNTLGTDLERDIIKKLGTWPGQLAEATKHLDPNRVTEFIFDICTTFNTMYNSPDHKILDLDGDRRYGLLDLCNLTGVALKSALGIIGIETLDAM